MTRTTYRQLQAAERMRIEIWKAEGISLRAMARRLGRSPATVSRELARNAPADPTTAVYDAVAAQALRARRRAASRPAAKLAPDSVLWGAVREMLSWKWSPQQIAATLRRTYPDDADFHVSHETIYTAIYAHPKGELRRELIACLRQGRSKRLPRSRGADRRGQIPERVSIHVRAPEIEDRLMPGHWEG
ncbi:IS30 family transposase, partial [Thiomonas sp.]